MRAMHDSRYKTVISLLDFPSSTQANTIPLLIEMPPFTEANSSNCLSEETIAQLHWKNDFQINPDVGGVAVVLSSEIGSIYCTG